MAAKMVWIFILKKMGWLEGLLCLFINPRPLILLLDCAAAVWFYRVNWNNQREQKIFVSRKFNKCEQTIFIPVMFYNSNTAELSHFSWICSREVEAVTFELLNWI